MGFWWIHIKCLWVFYAMEIFWIIRKYKKMSKIEFFTFTSARRLHNFNPKSLRVLLWEIKIFIITSFFFANIHVKFWWISRVCQSSFRLETWNFRKGHGKSEENNNERKTSMSTVDISPQFFSSHFQCPLIEHSIHFVQLKFIYFSSPHTRKLKFPASIPFELNSILVRSTFFSSFLNTQRKL